MMTGDQIDFLQQTEPPAARPYAGQPRGAEGMRQVTADHEDSENAEKRAVVLVMQRTAWQLWGQRKLALSVNDVRFLLAQLEYKGDPRVLSAAFPRALWTPVGYTYTTSPKANQREVRTFVPRQEYAWWRANTEQGRNYQPRRVTL